MVPDLAMQIEEVVPYEGGDPLYGQPLILVQFLFLVLMSFFEVRVPICKWMAVFWKSFILPRRSILVYRALTNKIPTADNSSISVIIDGYCLLQYV